MNSSSSSAKLPDLPEDVIAYISTFTDSDTFFRIAATSWVIRAKAFQVKLKVGVLRPKKIRTMQCKIIAAEKRAEKLKLKREKLAKERVQAENENASKIRVMFEIEEHARSSPDSHAMFICFRDMRFRGDFSMDQICGWLKSLGYKAESSTSSWTYGINVCWN